VATQFFLAVDSLFPDIEEGDELEEEHQLFIPFPLTMKKIPGQPYRGSDPEWREFVRLSKDPQAQRRVRGKVPVLICRKCTLRLLMCPLQTTLPTSPSTRPYRLPYLL
jgi:hypothetical protein